MKTRSLASCSPAAACTALAASLALAAPAAAQIQWSPPDQVGPRAGCGAAFDSARDRLVLIGGQRGSVHATGTWEWDGAEWQRRTPMNEPPTATVYRPQLVYDAVADVCMLHCLVPSPVHAEVWTWDGGDWTRHADAPTNAYLAFDAGAGRPVLLQRTSGTTPHELLEWNGAQWVARATSGTKPTWFDIGRLAYDAARGCLVFPVTDAVYELHGTVWQRIVPANHPHIQLADEPLHTATYDPRSGGVVVYGGMLYPNQIGNAAVWNGAAWTTLPAGRPRQQHAAVFDDVRDRLLVLGGGDSRDVFQPEWRYFDDLVGFDGAWSTVYDATPPSHLHGLAAANDRSRDVVVTFGGSWDDVPTDAMHVFDGERWRVEEPAIRPSPRRDAAMSWGGPNNHLLLFGGRGSGGALLGDTWIHHTTGWRQLATGGAPSPRAGARMAWDSGRGVVVLVGGQTAAGNSSETWEFNGVAWQLRAAGYPPASAFGGLAYDPTRARTVLYGGYAGDATYEWNGTAWFSTNPPHRPQANVQGQCAMTFDEARTRTVLVVPGGTSARTWEWDGADWTETTAPVQPPTNASWLGTDNFVYHAGTRRCVLLPDRSAFAATFRYGSANPAEWQPYGTGCAGAGIAPILWPFGFSRPWLGDTFVLRLQHPTATLGAAVVGLSDLAWSGGALPFPLGPEMPGCMLLASPDVFVVLPLVACVADYALSIPAVPAFVGLDLYFQGSVVDPAANAAGIVVSSGVHATIGVR